MDETKLLYAPMEPPRWETTQCGGALRYRASDGLLEQLWIITEYIGGSPSGQREEWHIVPTV